MLQAIEARVFHPVVGWRCNNTLATHDLVLAILRGSIKEMDAAAAWLVCNPEAPPRDYTSAGRPIY